MRSRGMPAAMSVAAGAASRRRVRGSISGCAVGSRMSAGASDCAASERPVTAVPNVSTPGAVPDCSVSAT